MRKKVRYIQNLGRIFKTMVIMGLKNGRFLWFLLLCCVVVFCLVAGSKSLAQFDIVSVFLCLSPLPQQGGISGMRLYWEIT